MSRNPLSDPLFLAMIQAQAAPPPATDPNFSSVSLLLPFDGANGSTTFTDRSNNSLTITVFGNTQISTAQSRWGGASGLFDGTGDYLRAPADGTAIGTGDFTLECWMRTTANNGFRAIASLVPGSDNNTLYVVSGSIAWFDGGNRVQSAALNNNVWYHVAVTRASGIVRTFVDGVASAGTYSSSANIGSNTLRIGANGAATGEWFHGHIDDFRLTKGIARYTANFTPPTAPFPTS